MNFDYRAKQFPMLCNLLIIFPCVYTHKCKSQHWRSELLGAGLLSPSDFFFFYPKVSLLPQMGSILRRFSK